MVAVTIFIICSTNEASRPFLLVKDQEGGLSEYVGSPTLAARIAALWTRESMDREKQLQDILSGDDYATTVSIHGEGPTIQIVHSRQIKIVASFLVSEIVLPPGKVFLAHRQDGSNFDWSFDKDRLLNDIELALLNDTIPPGY